MIIKLSYKELMESNYKLIYQTASIQDLKLSLHTIEVDIRAEQQSLEEANDYLEMQDIKRTISELNHEAAYVQELIDLYNESQLNSFENESKE
jgi:hypothetical protein